MMKKFQQQKFSSKNENKFKKITNYLRFFFSMNCTFMGWSPIIGAEPLMGAKLQLPPGGPGMKGA